MTTQEDTRTKIKEVLSKIKHLRLKVLGPVNDYLGEGYHSVFKGRGMEFDEVREYFIGDDPRNMDWNVTARYGRPFIKTFREERELTVMLLVDMSSSLNFGTKNYFKRELAIYTAATLASAALLNNDKIGMLVFPREKTHHLKPDKGEKHLYRVIHDLICFNEDDTKGDINTALHYLGSVQKKRAIVFLISDFIDEIDSKTIEIINRKHDLVAVCLSDPREKELPSLGIMQFKDAESGEVLFVDTSSKSIREEFKRKATEDVEKREKFFKRHNIAHVNISTDEDYVSAFIRFFKKRTKRR